MMNLDFTFDESAAISALGLENSSDEVKAVVIQQLKTTLDQRVGLRMQEELSPEQMKTFLAKAEASEAEGKQWLQGEVPHYKDLYQEELEALIDRLRRNADVMTNAAKQSAAE